MTGSQVNVPASVVIRSVVFATGQAVSTVLFAVPALLMFALPFRFRYGFLTRWTRFNLWWLRLVCGLRHRVEGIENIPAGPAIIFCKHQSAWETMALQTIFPPQIWLLKRELLWIPFFGWGLALLDPIAIDRKAGLKAIRQLINQGRQRLETGRWVVIFPEGTRVAPGKEKPFLPGGAKLAEATGVPVVPVAHNAGLFWPRRSFVKRPGTISIVVGPPIVTQGRSAKEINEVAAAWINPTTQRLCAPVVERENTGGEPIASS